MTSYLIRVKLITLLFFLFQKSINENEHLYSPRMVTEIKEGKNTDSKKKRVWQLASSQRQTIWFTEHVESRANNIDLLQFTYHTKLSLVKLLVMDEILRETALPRCFEVFYA